MHQRQRSPKDYWPEAVAYVRFPSLGKSVKGTERPSEALQTALRPLHPPPPGGAGGAAQPSPGSPVALRLHRAGSASATVRLTSVTDHLSSPDQRARHWENVHEGSSPDAVSWYQPEPVVSLELLDVLGVAPESAVIDIGGGASVLVDRLLARGFTDVTVLDISDAALRAGRQRVGSDPRVTWITEDLLSWEPARHYDLWHDRAAFHFLSGTEVDMYRNVLLRAVAPGGSVIMAAFAPDGPERCSGLPVTRYSADELGAVLESSFQVVEHRREVHTTPAGAAQPFTWIAARRSSPRHRRRA